MSPILSSNSYMDTGMFVKNATIPPHVIDKSPSCSL